MAFMLPALPYIAMGLAAGTAAYGSYQSGQAQKKVASANEDMAFNEAQAIFKATAEKEQQTRRKMNALMGEQRALYSKAGVDITSGSPLEVLTQQAEDAEKQALSVRYAGDAQAIGMLNKGSIMGYQGAQAEEAGNIGAIGSIFNTAAMMINEGTKKKGWRGTGETYGNW